MQPTQPARPRPTPVQDAQRAVSMDVLRGVAVLGILTMNIVSFALPGEAYINPMNDAVNAYAGEFAGMNRVVWWATFLFCDQKFMAIFSMLFGGGLIMMDRRGPMPIPPPIPGDAPPPPLASLGNPEVARLVPQIIPARYPPRNPFAEIYYRRLLALFIIGMVHAYLLWCGDILVAYAICACALYPLRRMRPAWLFAIGLAIMLVAIPVDVVLGWLSRAGGGGRPETDAETVDSAVNAMRGGVASVLAHNAAETLVMQTFIFAIWTFWRTLGLMLVGMALAKWGVFANARPRGFYASLALAGYAIGLPLIAIGALRSIEHRFDFSWAMLTDWHFNYFGAFFVALAHVGVVMLCVRTGGPAVAAGHAHPAPPEPAGTARRPAELGPISSRLAAVGRMALTNYLMQTIICTTIFFGWGFARYAHYERATIYLLVPVVWALELFWSPWWLRRFRFGPFEWAWRSLTYWKLQPMRRERVREDRQLHA